ncbi:MAG TPA: arginase family protein [Alphaproteobacteria bacterium]|nr:arginase family protein [Alphaproteobacteria bacterium]
MKPDYVVINAPSCLGLSPTGVERLPDSLKKYGLIEKLSARDGTSLRPAPYNPRRDEKTGYLNPEGIREFSLKLADAVGKEWDRGSVPIVLGGDCSILIGDMLELKRRGRYGLLFIDGHADYYGSHESPTGEAADMDLAIVTGAQNNDDFLADIEGLKPLVRPEDTVLFGFRDEKLAKQAGSQDVRKSAIHVFSLDDIRRIGWDEALRQALAIVTKKELKGFFIHFDVDVLDDVVMPAVDYRMPDGFTFKEASKVLRRARETGRLVGLNVTIFNPALDADGAIAQGLVDCLVDGLNP